MRLRYRADRQLRNGGISLYATMARDAGLASVRVEPFAFSVRDPAAVDNVIGLS
jgi:hypothetical protein